MQDGIQYRIAEMLDRLNILHRGYYGANTTLLSPTFRADYGSKRAKIVLQNQGDSRRSSVYCFVDLSNGDILKAAGWNAPAKGKRGSIWNGDCDVGADKPCNVHGGGLYLRS